MASMRAIAGTGAGIERTIGASAADREAKSGDAPTAESSTRVT
jgi:hypothetical protein